MSSLSFRAMQVHYVSINIAPSLCTSMGLCGTALFVAGASGNSVHFLTRGEF